MVIIIIIIITIVNNNNNNNNAIIHYMGVYSDSVARNLCSKHNYIQ